jgi:hypothetical protein
MEKAQGFEVTEYSDEQVIPGRIQGVISDIIRDQVRDIPSVGIQVSFTGNLVRLTYHSYEFHLPSSIKQVEQFAKSGLDETVKHLKKEFKVRTGETLDLKEQKDLANTSVQKVSLNERYMYSSWRFYEIG